MIRAMRSKSLMPFILLVVLTAALVAGCSGSGSDSTDTMGEGLMVAGVVTEVEGDISTVKSFVVLDQQGNSHRFIPADGMLVMGVAPPHLRDHVLSGDPVTVMYHETPEGVLVADNVDGEHRG